MYTENQIIEIMNLRSRRWALLTNEEKDPLPESRRSLDTINKKLYNLTGRHQYL
jgi:hypothetical protein